MTRVWGSTIACGCVDARFICTICTKCEDHCLCDYELRTSAAPRPPAMNAPATSGESTRK